MPVRMATGLPLFSFKACFNPSRPFMPGMFRSSNTTSKLPSRWQDLRSFVKACGDVHLHACRIGQEHLEHIRDHAVVIRPAARGYVQHRGWKALSREGPLSISQPSHLTPEIRLIFGVGQGWVD